VACVGGEAVEPVPARVATAVEEADVRPRRVGRPLGEERVGLVERRRLRRVVGVVRVDAADDGRRVARLDAPRERLEPLDVGVDQLCRLLGG